MKLFLIAALAAVAAAQHGNSYGHDEYDAKTPYAYDYAVHDPHYGAQFNKKETSDGGNVEGSYSVVLPDGRTQHVKYYADHYGGFNADVSYEGYAQYPEHHAPAYKAAPAYKPAPAYHEPAYKPAYKPVHKPAYTPTYKAAPLYKPVY
ncbi:cuticle protein 7-like [Amphibalanus amphitrite]|uniref:cuticle protein 7-like n=1 Tax=Amphibalanus amphitrite TaxID=1232801 RepID=UPI001C8FFC60|nr:cuticle protein 7-like [Amphibalanus amphitrite]XP_043210051.1 cuticle protein 7-like [Amphibalanus amphitrite]